MVPSNRKRLYKVWRGSNRFFCGGRLIFGPDVSSIFLSTALIVGPLIALCCQVITKLQKHGSSSNSGQDADQNQVLGFPVLIVTIIIGITDLMLLFLTSSTDPGIVPRNKRPPESDEGIDTPNRSMEWINATSPNLRLPRTKDILINGYTVKVKFCDTCLLYRPPRTSHCSICNNCVQKFDHHCPWVGQCIGLRNYRFFFLFISTSTFLCIYVFILSWLNILAERKNHHNSVLKSMKGEVVSLVLIIYTFITVWFVGGLTVFHLYLISTNQTTYENFRYRYDKKENPYNNGILLNLKEVFFSKIAPSMNNFRSWVPEEASEIGSFRSHNGLGIINLKEKIDLEIGNKGTLDGSVVTPTILRGLDYSAIENNLHAKERQEADVFGLPAVPHASEQEPRNSNESCKGASGTGPVTTDNEERGNLALAHQDAHMQSL